MANHLSFKVVLAGTAGSGKTAAVHHVLTGENRPQPYAPTIGADVHPLTYDLNGLRVCLNVWDLAGVPAYECLPDGYYLQANGVIVVADNPDTYLDRALRVCPNALVMIVRPGEIDDATFAAMRQRLLER